WASANVNHTQPVLKGVFKFRVEAPLFGTNVPKMARYTKKVPDPINTWPDWPLDGAETNQAIFLDQSYEEVDPASYILIQQGDGPRLVRRIDSVQTLQRNENC